MKNSIIAISEQIMEDGFNVEFEVSPMLVHGEEPNRYRKEIDNAILSIEHQQKRINAEIDKLNEDTNVS